MKRSGRVLVVDDEAGLVDALCEALREEGFEVTGYADPTAALAALRPGAFDLLLSDLMMPEIDGVRLLKRAFHTDASLVGVIMTGQGSVSTAAEAIHAGASDFELKPFRRNQILSVIDRAVEARQLREEREMERRVADTVREGHRSGDVAAHLGGEEFMSVKNSAVGVILGNLRRLAISDEYSPDFEAGVMSVVRDVEDRGVLIPRHLEMLITLAHCPAQLSPSERATAERLRVTLGCSVAEAEQYARGVQFAESRLCGSEGRWRP